MRLFGLPALHPDCSDVAVFVFNGNYWCPAQLCLCVGGYLETKTELDEDVGVTFITEQRKQLYSELLQQHCDIGELQSRLDFLFFFSDIYCEEYG